MAKKRNKGKGSQTAKRTLVPVKNQKLLCDDCEEGEPCEWDGEVGEELRNYAEMLENQDLPNNNMRFHLYRHYSFAQHGPSVKGLRVPLPWCVELAIKREYPGDGKSAYMFFKKAKASTEE